MSAIHLAASGDRPVHVMVINSNASATVTAQIAGALEGRLPPATTATIVSPDTGPEGIDSALDLLIAGYETVKIVATAPADVDAFVIACGNDPGLAAARQVTDRPVVGLAEAGILEACMLGANFAIPVFSPAKVTPMRQLVASYGLSSRLAAVVAMDTSTAAAARNPEVLLEQLCVASAAARDLHHAEVIVLTGSVMAGHADGVATSVGIPAVAGLRAAMRAASSLASGGARTSQRFSYRTPTKSDALIGHLDLHHAYTNRPCSGPTANPKGTS